MSIRPIREVPAAREVAELISDFDRPSFGTLRGPGCLHEVLYKPVGCLPGSPRKIVWREDVYKQLGVGVSESEMSVLRHNGVIA